MDEQSQEEKPSRLVVYEEDHVMSIYAKRYPTKVQKGPGKDCWYIYLSLTQYQRICWSMDPTVMIGGKYFHGVIDTEYTKLCPYLNYKNGPINIE